MPHYRRLLQAAATACALCASVAVAGDTPPASEPAPSQPAMRAFIDPVTGELREPTAAELEGLAAESKALRKPSAMHPDFAGTPDTVEAAAKTLQVHPDGSVSALVPDELLTNLVAHVGPGGRVAVHHRGPGAPAEAATLRKAARPAVEVADE